MVMSYTRVAMSPKSDIKLRYTDICFWWRTFIGDIFLVSNDLKMAFECPCSIIGWLRATYPDIDAMQRSVYMAYFNQDRYSRH